MDITQYGISLTEKQGASLRVSCDGNTALIEYATIPEKLRGHYLLEAQLKRGNRVFDIRQQPHFNLCGPMLDVSRGGVMTVESVCDYIQATASLGLNMLMLYTEDVYDLPDYPTFGYMRGRYSLEELRRIDDYAAALGVEVIPCIQTLGHLTNFIRWGKIPSEAVSVLLPENEEVYAFIEAEIAFMHQAFRSRRIHIGMDEARGLAHGRYFREHGPTDAFDLFNRHLNRVMEITRKYDYHPMIWADMYFSCRYEGDYYNPRAVIPQHAIDSAPGDLELIFWDYYHTNYDLYDNKLTQYERFPHNEVGFGGGIWTWDGMLPNFRYTAQTMLPALRACLDHNVGTVIATMWGNDGCECLYDLAKSGLALFSEVCYLGKDCTMEDIWQAAEYISGENEELTDALSDFYMNEHEACSVGKSIFYSDLLIDTFCRDTDLDQTLATYRHSLEVVNKYPDNPNHGLYSALFKAVIRKTALMASLRREYLAGNRDYLRQAAEEEIPLLRADYRRYYDLYAPRWYAYHKPFNFQKFPLRFGGMDLRLENIASILMDYVEGRTNRIEELDEERLTGLNVSWKNATFFTGFWDN